MSRSESLAAYLRAQARRQLDRVEANDGGRNARSALALLDTAAYAAGLPEDDPLILMLAEVGCFASGTFDPGEAGARLVRRWEGGEPHELLLALPAAMAA
ncbi:hypothetical protein MF672_028630 [Actinomadura sp. ATCC 31491]|uniref:Uncharacterized protein n=1 Tax=Actinomadura luzonensis TaxID=2805427 RepID=A0ABT0FZF5_9ACTN|nr:hypothetical protein [Actinomadura luzonensis]MCK2217730.1 hypothetical protein [Actinomadura luzonensis]